MQKTIMLGMLLACGAAYASEWVLLAKFTNGSSDRVDVSSIRVAGSVRSAWFKYFYPPQTERGAGDNANKWVHYDLSREEFDCAKGNRRTEALLVYYDDGTYFSTQLSDERQWRPVPPESIADGQMKFVCARKPK